MKQEEINGLLQKIDSLKDCLMVREFNKGDPKEELRVSLKVDPNASLILTPKDEKCRIDFKKILDGIYECKFLNDNYSYKAIKDAILDDIFNILRKHQTEYTYFDELCGKVPEGCLVVGPICGMEISSVKKIGGHAFFYSYDELDEELKSIQGFSSNRSIKENFPSLKFPCIGVVVTAIDHEKAREKASEKFRAFENVVQFMVGKCSDKFFIRVVSPDILYCEESICMAKDSCSGSFAWKGPFGDEKAHSISDPFFTNTENTAIWSLWEKKDVSDWEKKLIRSINWIGRSLRSSDLNMAFLQMLFSLESLLVLQQKDFLNESVTAKLADSVAYILGNDYMKRTEIAKKMKNFYALRSKIVHFGSESISLSEFLELFVICKSVIISFFRVKELKEIKSNNDLMEWFNSKRYS